MQVHRQQERRKVPRFPQRNVFASITFGSRRSAISCLVRDLSRAGAKVWTLAVKIIPDNFVLTLDESGEVAHCVVIWRSETELGVVFDTAPPF